MAFQMMCLDLDSETGQFYVLWAHVAKKFFCHFEALFFDCCSLLLSTVQCPQPGVSENGVVGSETERRQGAMITFQCNRGFSPLKVLTSVCASNGTWSPGPGSFQCSPGTY